MNSTNNVFYRAVTDLIQSDQIEKALAGLEEFLDKNADDEYALSLYGSALMRSGDTQKALSTFKRAAALYPDKANTHTNLAFTAMKSGDREQAIESYENATKVSPGLYPAWVHLGKLYFDAGNFEAASVAFDKSAKLDPLEEDSEQLQSFLQSEKFAEAEEMARSMLDKQPGHPRAVLSLAHLAGTVGAHDERVEFLNQGLDRHPASTRLRNEIIGACEAVGDHAAALQHAKILVRMKPNSVNYRTLNRIYSHVGDYRGALASAEKAASYLDADSPEIGQIDLLRGNWLKILGRRAESESAFRASIEHLPDCGAGWWGLADLKTYQFSDQDKQSMENLARKFSASADQRCRAAFALAKAYDNDGDHQTAFRWYHQANELKTGIKYAPEKHSIICQQTIAETDTNMLAVQARPAPIGPTPIFIVGMPRSGSTLIEQILASHSQIEGTMELMTLPYLKRAIRNEGSRKYNKHYLQSLREFSEAELCAFGQAYLDKTAIYRDSKPFFIDKLPPNFERVGLIHKILPQAIIIDARRHPLDCGFSAYKQLFASGHDYSYDLGHIGSYFNIYLQLMDHWDKVLPGRVKLVQYEDMVNDTEQTIRSILDHVGVDFEEACLQFFENRRAVKTASSEQVRQPIYSESVGRWKTVSEQLKPLIDSLGPETMARFQGKVEAL